MDTQAILDELERSPAEIRQMSFEQIDAPEISPAAVRPVSRRVSRRPLAVKPPARPAVQVTGRHQDVRLYLTVLLKTFTEMTDAGLVREAPFQVRLADGSLAEPDIVCVASANFERVHETVVEGPLDVILEVLSKESTAQDRGEKFVAYETAGVREYWVVDPIRELVSVYYLGPDGLYDESKPDTAGRLRSRVLKGLAIDTTVLWRRVLPTTVEIVEAVQAMVNQK